MPDGASAHLAELRSLLSNRARRLTSLYRITDRQANVVKFQPNAAQLRFLENAHTFNVIVKARQLGFTTLVQLLMLDAAMFTNNVKCGTIAHRQEDAEAIFREKVRFAYEGLPEPLRKANAADMSRADTLRFANGSELRVSTSLRSGTFQMLHISEYGKLSVQNPIRAKEVRTGALNTVAPGEFVVVESTAEGQEGEFYDLYKRAKELQDMGQPLGPLDPKLHFEPWYTEPAYVADPITAIITAEMREYFEDLEGNHGIVLTPAQKAFYVAKAATQGEDMSREYPSTVEEAFEVTLKGAYYAEAMTKAAREQRITKVPHEPALSVETWWDLGMDDMMAIWFIQRHPGGRLGAIRYEEDNGEGLGYYARLLDDLGTKHGYRYSQHVAPHDIKVRELGTGKSRLETAQQLGINFSVCPQHDVADGIETVRNTLARVYFDAENCHRGLSALRSYRRAWDEARGTYKRTPLHDWASHGADAFRTGAMGHAPTTDWGKPMHANLGTVV